MALDDDDHRASRLAPTPQHGVVVDQHDERCAVGLAAPAPSRVRPSVGGILLGRREDCGHRGSRLAPTPQHGVVVDQHDERRAVGLAAPAPPRVRPSVGGILLARREDCVCAHRGVAASPPSKPSVGGPCLPTSLRPQPYEVRVPSEGHRRLPFGTRHRQQLGGGVDHHDERPAVAGASLPPTPRPRTDVVRRLPFGTLHPQQRSGIDNHDERPAIADPGGIFVGDASLHTTARPRTDVVRRLPFLTRHPQQRSGVDNHDEVRAVADAGVILPCGSSLSTASRPQTHAVRVPSDGSRRHFVTTQRAVAKAQEVVVLSDDDDDDDHRLPTFDGRRPLFLTPPPAAKADNFGLRGSRRAIFYTPPAADDSEDEESTLPPPKRRTDGEGGVDHTVSSALTKLPSCNRPGRSAAGGGSSSSSCVRGGRQGRGAGRAGGSRGQVGGSTGRGSRARALAELLGNNAPKLKPDSGPAPGQGFNEWQDDRNMDLGGEYEYLDGLLTRINELPQGRRITALARKGWVEFYTRLEVCMVVRRQMREAKANPTEVPKRLMAEVR